MQSRGLLITDVAEAERALARLSYYRLAAYFLSFQTPGDPTHSFRPGTTLETVIGLYEFDEALRSLVFRATGTIEIALRAQLAYHNALLWGPHWYENPRTAISSHRFQGNLVALDKDLGRAHEMFLDHYRATYSSPQRPPCWMAFEVASFGIVSKLLHNLRSSPATKAIGAYFGVDDVVLKSWAQMLSYVRNICAHHSRLWNRTLTIKPVLPRRPRNLWPVTGPMPQDDRLYIVLVVAAYLLDAIDPRAAVTFKQELKALLQAHPTIPQRVMDFPANWQQDVFWQ
nr:Abi family protein [Hymenobacter profundi]